MRQTDMLVMLETYSRVLFPDPGMPWSHNISEQLDSFH